ncbi:hypothetical protein LLH23_05890 [bacterium]|nr:hypothetical protein [bacterium]
MASVVCELLTTLLAMTEDRRLRWESAASEETYVASVSVPNGVLVFEISMEQRFNDNGDLYSREALYVKRRSRDGDERRYSVEPEDNDEWRVLENLYSLASSAETREFIEDVLQDLRGSVKERPLPVPPNDYGPMDKDEDPFGDQ